MKLLKSIQLFFQEGNSDKVYEIDLLEAGADAYVVNFRYGRRGATLKEGTKTVFPVALAEAEKLFNDLESEKRKKGYAAQGENANFIAEIIPVKADKGQKRHKVIISLLKAAINEDEHETWPVSRIIWRAGELGIEDAAPSIIKLADKSEPIQLYACIWSLSKIGYPKAVSFFQEILKEKHPAYILNLAQAALLNVCDDDLLKKEIASLSAKLPESLQQAIKSEEKFLNAFCHDLFTKFGSGSCDFLVPFYLISIKDARLRNAFVLAIKEVPVKAGYFKFVRQIFKISEMLNDTQVYGILVKIIEKAPATFSTSYTYVNNKWTETSEELKKENSALAFSQKTKEYFGRRMLRTLRKLGNDKSVLYTKYATDIMLQFDDEKDLTSPEKKSDVNYIYNSEDRNYTRVENITWYDTYSNYRPLYYILYANSTRYRLPAKATKWQCLGPFTPGQTFEPLREEAFAVLWNEAPDDIIRLLCESGCERVSDFALFVFQNNSAFKEKITEEHILAFIKNNAPKTQRLGFDLVKELYAAKAPGALIITALLMSKIEEARVYAQQCIDKDPAKFANDGELILAILLSPNLASHQWLDSFLIKNKAQTDVLKKVLNDVFDVILSNQLILKEEYIASLSVVLESNFKEVLSKTDPSVIFSLLSHPELLIQGFAAKLLSLCDLDPSLVSDKIIFDLLQSENKMARKAAIDLLDKLEAKSLSEKQSLVLSLCLSPLQDVRQSAQKLVDKLLVLDASVGYGLVNLFLPVLTVKEKHEGLHQDIFELLSGKLASYLTKIESKQILSLCVSRYLASQELGNFLLKNADADKFSVKELNSLANSNLLANRQYVMGYFSAKVDRMRDEKKDSIMLCDGVFEDVRKFAFDFYRTHFTDQDWEPELFIALCDSTKEDVQAFGREMITKWFEKDNGFDYLLRLSQHPDSRMQLFASGFLDQYAKNNYEMLQKLGDFFVTLLSQINKGRTSKIRAIHLLSNEAMVNEQNAFLISAIFNRMSATASIQDKALYIKAMLNISKAFPTVDLLIKKNEVPVYNKVKQKEHAVRL